MNEGGVEVFQHFSTFRKNYVSEYTIYILQTFYCYHIWSPIILEIYFTAGKVKKYTTTTFVFNKTSLIIVIDHGVKYKYIY